MKIKKLTFILENCEVIEIDGKYIGEICISKIKEKFRRIAVNAVETYKECGKFYIEIHKDANIEYKSFNIGEPKKIFDRLEESPDITHIEIECDNNQIYEYVVKWAGNSDYANKLQDSYIGDQGTLFIKIGKKNIEKYFKTYDMDKTKWPWINE